MGAWPPLFGGQGPFVGGRRPFFGAKAPWELPKSAFGLEKGAPAVSFAFFRGERTRTQPRDTRPYPFYRPVGTRQATPRSGELAPSQQTHWRVPPLSHMRAQYTISPEISRPVFTEMTEQLRFCPFFGTFLASREAFFGARARKVAEKTTFRAHGTSSGPSGTLAVLIPSSWPNGYASAHLRTAFQPVEWFVEVLGMAREGLFGLEYR